MPPPTRLKSSRLPWVDSGTSSSLTFCLAAKMARACGVIAGAMITSTNCLATASAVAPSSGWLNAMMPPKALVGSVCKALA